MALTTRAKRTWVGSGHGGLAASAHSPLGSLHSGSRDWNGSCGASPCAGSTSASSACWHLRVSLSIRGCNPSHWIIDREVHASEAHGRRRTGTVGGCRQLSDEPREESP